MNCITPDYAIEFRGTDLSQDNDIGQRYIQSGNVDVPRRSTFSELTAFYQTKLFRIVENNLRLYCGHPQSMTAEAACNQYKQYVTWEQRLPPQFRDAITGDGARDPLLPHIIYLQ